MIGVLALQGGFAEHCAMLERLGRNVREVRTVEDLDGVEGLIIPGGESTTISRQLAAGLANAIAQRVRQGLPVFGTCAGAILLAKHVIDSDVPTLELLDITVERNAYGRQTESFETTLQLEEVGDVPAVFIRAPIIRTANCEVLAEQGGAPVCVRQGNILAATFHPELTQSTKLHELFLTFLKATKPL